MGISLRIFYLRTIMITPTRKMLRSFLSAVLSGIALATFVVHAQDQSGFISIDCGAPDIPYTDPITGINYISDKKFIDTGVTKRISSEFTSGAARQLQYVRSFPQGKRNCYEIVLKRSTKYLIRAAFMYGNHDGRNQAPQFDMHIGADYWVTIKNATSVLNKEIIHVATMNYEHVCLVNTNSGTPFISALELRPLNNASYVAQSGSLALEGRYDVASATNDTVRYPADVFDRIWLPYHLPDSKEISTRKDIVPSYPYSVLYKPPSDVMRTAATPSDANKRVRFYRDNANTTHQSYVYMHFAEIVDLQANQSRMFNISFNENPWDTEALLYLMSTIVFTTTSFTGGIYNFSLYKIGGSTLPPLINAYEVYSVVELSQSKSDPDDVDAITSMRKKYGMKKGWQGDPCAPPAYSWDGIGCNYVDYEKPRITSLNLSSSGLTGGMSYYIRDLKLLQNLDLSNNSLTGPVPSFLSDMEFLKVLN